MAASFDVNTWQIDYWSADVAANVLAPWPLKHLSLPVSEEVSVFGGVEDIVDKHHLAPEAKVKKGAGKVHLWPFHNS